jgi:16S rRNA (guanine527-N7)-methyltransferase
MSQHSDLERYAALLLKWNAVQNLVSRETVGELWPRHIEDSLQLMKFLRPSDVLMVDIGSGGGFPAIPMAIASRETARTFTLVEPIAKKVAFLRTVARELDLPVTVLGQRAEALDSRETFDCLTSRALAALPVLCVAAATVVKTGGHCLFPKGRNYRQELDAAAANFHFDVVVHPSESDAEGVILEITNLRAKSAA